MARVQKLTRLEPGQRLLVGGDGVVTVDERLANEFKEGDALRVVEKTGQVLHIPAREQRIVSDAVGRTHDAFRRMGDVDDERISRFFEGFAVRLEDDAVWSEIANVNERDVEAARARGRSTTRLVANEKMRRGMVSGLRGWIDAASVRGRVLERVDHGDWSAELVGAELGVVGFVFEGRPNVVADATGVLRGGNTVVFRIGRDALDTARAIVRLATRPALEAAGLPADAVTLIESAEHAAGWALFSDTRLSLAVARGSGPAVATLGGLARNAGIPVSLHGTGGAWLLVGESADPSQVESAIVLSLDRKVCNTLNTLCLPESRTSALMPQVLAGLERAGKRRGQSFKLHVVRGAANSVPAQLFEHEVRVRRASGDCQEKQAEWLDEADLGKEWEWEDTPEITLLTVPNTEHAVELFNRYSPQFVISVSSRDAAEHEHVYRTANAPFVGDGFTRWVDGQFALNRPELGLSNWQNGRLFGRGGVLSGDSVFTVRTRARGTDKRQVKED